MHCCSWEPSLTQSQWLYNPMNLHLTSAIWFKLSTQTLHQSIIFMDNPIHFQSLSSHFDDLRAAVNKAGYAVRKVKEALAVAEELQVVVNDTDSLTVDVACQSITIQASSPMPCQARNGSFDSQPAISPLPAVSKHLKPNASASSSYAKLKPGDSVIPILASITGNSSSPNPFRPAFIITPELDKALDSVNLPRITNIFSSFYRMEDLPYVHAALVHLMGHSSHPVLLCYTLFIISHNIMLYHDGVKYTRRLQCFITEIQAFLIWGHDILGRSQKVMEPVHQCFRSAYITSPTDFSYLSPLVSWCFILHVCGPPSYPPYDMFASPSSLLSVSSICGPTSTSGSTTRILLKEDFYTASLSYSILLTSTTLNPSPLNTLPTVMALKMTGNLLIVVWS
ncbi:hypothetical protein JVT61DRAFT_9912 [Boletus reticuloceps]|uniref:Uncharacterized protein n=1 Tax=Boletus reticuloceps TaxID=495285 RepID=A0A8I2YFU5_9AGAM|nr:hypothetical protein JVT61DRAFT_9912 [Boletus reticuloceps]